MTASQALYVYGVVAAGASTPGDVTGLRETPVELLEHDGIAAVVSTVDVERPLGKRADLLAHGRVLDAFAARCAVVPIRFGSVLPDRSEVLAGLLEPGSARFRELLDELSGRVQFNLRARYDEEVILTEVVRENPAVAKLREQTRNQPEAATYYSRMRLGELVARAVARKREAESQVVLDALAPHSVAHSIRDGEGVDHLLDAAFLVETKQQEPFEQAAEATAASLHGRARLRLVGPLAAYDFVTEE